MKATLTKAAYAVASTALVLGSLAGCGSDSDSSGAGAGIGAAPTAASSDDFCTAFNGLIGQVLSQIGTGDASKGATALRDWAATMEEVGTPADMPDDARRGFEVVVEQAAQIDDDVTLEDLKNFGDDVDADDRADSEAFGAWATDNCPSPLPDMSDLASSLPSDLASVVPSDLASQLASSLPSDLASRLPTELPTSQEELESMLSELTASAG